MRSLPIDHCPSCGVRANGNTYCASCEVDMVDANGLPRIEPSRDEAASARRPKTVAAFIAASFLVKLTFTLLDPMTYRHDRFAFRMLAAVVGSLELAFVAYAIWLVFAARRHLRLVRPWKLARGIAATNDGDVRIRGVVTTIIPSAVPETTETTAIRVGRQVIGGASARDIGDWIGALLEFQLDPTRLSALLSRRVVLDSSVSGRFAVKDGTGVAVVDDDAIEVFDARPFWSRLASPFESIEDGDEVEVLGPARRELAADACILGGATPEQARAALVFDGRPDAKVRILLRRSLRRAASAESNGTPNRRERVRSLALSRSVRG